MSTRRIVWWNLALIAAQSGLLLWAHAIGVTWATLALTLGGVLLAGAGALVYLSRVSVSRARRWPEQQLRAGLAVDSVQPPADPSAPACPAAATTRRAA